MREGESKRGDERRINASLCLIWQVPPSNSSWQQKSREREMDDLNDYRRPSSVEGSYSKVNGPHGILHPSQSVMVNQWVNSHGVTFLFTNSHHQCHCSSHIQLCAYIKDLNWSKTQTPGRAKLFMATTMLLAVSYPSFPVCILSVLSVKALSDSYLTRNVLWRLQPLMKLNSYYKVHRNNKNWCNDQKIMQTSDLQLHSKP